jgi:hypothetical protein
MRRRSPASAIAFWQSFWFREIPSDVFALLRIAFGLFGLINVLGQTPVSMLWDLDGIMRSPGGGLGVKAWIDDLGMAGIAGSALFSAVALSFAAMTAGFQSGAAVAASFAGTVLYAYWNPLPRYGADDVLLVVLFCLLWADCGKRISVDAWLAARSGPVGPPVATQPIWPLRLLQIQVALIYLNSGLWKLFGETWRDGSAIHYALEYNLLHRFPFEIPSGLEVWLVVATFTTLLWELGFAFLVLHPVTRRIALVMGVLVHGGIFVLLEIGVFSWVMMATYLAFLDPERVAQLVGRWGARRSPLVSAIATGAVGTDDRAV